MLITAPESRDLCRSQPLDEWKTNHTNPDILRFSTHLQCNIILNGFPRYFHGQTSVSLSLDKGCCRYGGWWLPEQLGRTFLIQAFRGYIPSMKTRGPSIWQCVGLLCWLWIECCRYVEVTMAGEVLRTRQRRKPHIWYAASISSWNLLIRSLILADRDLRASNHTYYLQKLRAHWGLREAQAALYFDGFPIKQFPIPFPSMQKPSNGLPTDQDTICHSTGGRPKQPLPDHCGFRGLSEPSEVPRVAQILSKPEGGTNPMSFRSSVHAKKSLHFVCHVHPLFWVSVWKVQDPSCRSHLILTMKSILIRRTRRAVLISCESVGGTLIAEIFASTSICAIPCQALFHKPSGAAISHPKHHTITSPQMHESTGDSKRSGHWENTKFQFLWKLYHSSQVITHTEAVEAFGYMVPAGTRHVRKLLVFGRTLRGWESLVLSLARPRPNWRTWKNRCSPLCFKGLRDKWGKFECVWVGGLCGATNSSGGLNLVAKSCKWWCCPIWYLKEKWKDRCESNGGKADHTDKFGGGNLKLLWEINRKFDSARHFHSDRACGVSSWDELLDGDPWVWTDLSIEIKCRPTQNIVPI